MVTETEKTVSVKLSDGSRELIQIKIPQNINSGEVIKYQGLGDNMFPSLTRGDLYVRININSHSRFEKHGANLLSTETINCFEAILGTEKIIQTLDQRSLKVTIPKGSQHGTILVLNEEGLLDKHGSKGDLFIKVYVKIPENLTDKQLELVEKLR